MVYTPIPTSACPVPSAPTHRLAPRHTAPPRLSRSPRHVKLFGVTCVLHQHFLTQRWPREKTIRAYFVS
ncbi:hypothetical protein E2C01_005223 [Portunus trituberculatus]|uniref:Uncharacterized protein n=1 Tax=Portunus trituberculatus TaxID=210409 RepID=A0A5B7CUY7_PORTR|nr:hypothetical protein [Portunus trituberculatus]